MLSLSLPIFVSIQACMRTWHQIYSAEAAFFPQNLLPLPHQNTTADDKSEMDRNFGDYIAAESEGLEGSPIDIT